MNAFRNLTTTLILLLFTGTALAVTWSPTDVELATGDVNTINLSTDGTGMFGIFALGALPQVGGFADLAIASVDKITFNLLGNNTWNITNLAGDTFNLGTSFYFNFAYFDGVNWLEEPTAFELAPGSSIWQLQWGPGISLQAVDVMPIPVPPAIILFASGLLALAGMRRSSAG